MYYVPIFYINGHVLCPNFRSMYYFVDAFISLVPIFYINAPFIVPIYYIQVLCKYNEHYSILCANTHTHTLTHTHTHIYSVLIIGPCILYKHCVFCIHVLIYFIYVHIFSILILMSCINFLILCVLVHL